MSALHLSPVETLERELASAEHDSRRYDRAVVERISAVNQTLQARADVNERIFQLRAAIAKLKA